LRALVSFAFERERTNFISAAVVACAAGGGGSARWPAETPHFNRPVSPGQRDERRHGQTLFFFGAKLGRDGVAAGLCFRSRHDSTRQRRGKIPSYC